MYFVAVMLIFETNAEGVNMVVEANIQNVVFQINIKKIVLIKGPNTSNLQSWKGLFDPLMKIAKSHLAPGSWG
jgi:hypothetical protein